MPTKRRLADKNGEEVTAYDRLESLNLAARTMAQSETELGMYCAGVMTGMAMCNPKFNKANVDETIDAKIAYACIAQACHDINVNYLDIKRDMVITEVRKGPAWVSQKQRHTDEMIAAGKIINESLDKIIKNEIDLRVGEYEKVMVDSLKGAIDVAPEKDDPEADN